MNRFASSMNFRSLLALAALASFGLTGCQTAQTGNPMPSPNYLNGQVQHFPTGPKFKLEQEAAAMKAYSEQQAQAGRSYVDQQVQAGRDYAGQQVQAGQAYAGQQVQAGYAYADQQLQAGRAFADQQVQQASGMIPSMSSLPMAQPANSSVTISAE
jgi:hypothetical protein